MSKKMAQDVYEETSETTRKRIEFSQSDIAWMKQMESKTGLSWDDLVFAGLQALRDNPSAYLVKAVEERAKRQLAFLNSLQENKE